MWIVVLKNRGFSVRHALQAIRAQGTVANRQTQIAALRQAVRTDQAAMVQAVTAAGGVAIDQYWVVNALVVEVSPVALPTLRAHPRVERLVPVRSYPVADSETVMAGEMSLLFPGPPLAPIDISTDALNHNIDGAWTILGGGHGMPQYKGAGARVAVFDTGIDADVFDQRTTGAQNDTPDPHPSFRVGTTSASRVEAHLQAQVVNATTRHADVNILQVAGGTPYVGLTPPFGFRASRHHSHSGHGTAMAAIISGTTIAASPRNIGAGHAPGATLVDVACSSYQLGSTALQAWEFTDNGLLGGIEKLREYILLNGSDATKVHVLNLSLGGDPTPSGPVPMALDSLAREEDILLVCSAGNDSDTTTSSLGFYHGLAVGAVHARSATDPTYPAKPGNLAFRPMPESSRGPLASDHRRLYPDVCATGAGPGSLQLNQAGSANARVFRYPGSFTDTHAQGTCLLMPGIDTLDLAASTAGNPGVSVSPIRWNRGTSEAAAQVSGAAALYRGRLPDATAEETRAALLLNVLGTFTSEDGMTADTSLQHTFKNRNTYGVGYVRDDLLAQFAVRDASIQPLVQVVTLNAATPVTTVTYGPLTPGLRYGVVACWRRYVDLDFGSEPPPEAELPNVDLEVEAGGNLLARSATPANSYERVVFLAPSGGGSVTLRVRIVSSPQTDQDLLVQVAARQFAVDLDPMSAAEPLYAVTGQQVAMSAGASCTTTSAAWNVARIVPVAYANAYGSAPFQFAWNPNPPYFNWMTHAGYNRGFNLAAGSPNAPGNSWVRVDVSATQMGNQAITIDGLAFRSSNPVAANADLPVTVYLQEGGAFGGSGGPPVGSFSASGTLRRVAANAGDLTLDSFPVQILFTTPFVYNATGTFHVWVQVGQYSPGFVVEGTDDGAGMGYDSYYWKYSGLPLVASPVNDSGRAPILGLLTMAAPVSRELRLELFGEPWSANGANQNEVMWRLSGPANSVYAVEVGGMASAGAGSPCAYWLTNPFFISAFPFPITDAFGSAHGYILVPASIAGIEYGLQATFLSPSVRSNAIRITIGGGL